MSATDVLLALDEIDALIASGPLAIAFQPIVNLASGQLEGHEVLGRCLTPDGGIAPMRLLDAAYKHGRLLALDRRWRTLAVEAIARHPDPSTRYFINVDPRVAHDPDFAPGFTQQLIERHGLAPERFVLELTETSLLAEDLELVLHHYAAQGFRVAIDDLGAGAHSLATLLRLRPHYIKLDRELVRGIDRDPGRAALVRAFADFGARTGARVIAESIETEAELRAVVDAGADCAQGFLIGRPADSCSPLPPNELVARRTRRRAFDSDDDVTPVLTKLIEKLHQLDDLSAALHHVTECARELIDVERVNLRLLDESRTQLLIAARSGPPTYERQLDFKVGEGLVGWVVANARPLRLACADEDPRFARRGHGAAMGSFVGVPVVDAKGCIGVLSTATSTKNRFSLADEARLNLVAGIVSPHLQIVRLSRLAKTDPLTGLLNRHALDEVLPQLPDTDLVSVAMIDLDHFKGINDRRGHAVGDQMLREAAAAITSVVRRDDDVIRIGGEEFLVVLPGVDERAARTIAERARFRIGELSRVLDERMTASAGVAQRRSTEPRDALLQRVDDALYRAKSLGRNCVVVSRSHDAGTLSSPVSSEPQ